MISSPSRDNVVLTIYIFLTRFVCALGLSVFTRPHFIRFSRTPAGQGLAALQAKRTALAASEIGSMSVDEVGEIGQFLSTLLVLQGVANVDAEDKAILIPKLRQWERAFPGRLAANTSDRCLALLTDDP